MNRVVWTEDGEDFTIIDAKGILRVPHPDELHKYATPKEIAEARHRYEASLMPLPQYDVASGMYYWQDQDDLWDDSDVIDDIKRLWPLMNVELLLESSRLMAQLGIKD